MCKYCGEIVGKEVEIAIGDWTMLKSVYTKHNNNHYNYEYEKMAIIAYGDGIAINECSYCFNCGREILTDDKAFDIYWDNKEEYYENF